MLRQYLKIGDSIENRKPTAYILAVLKNIIEKLCEKRTFDLHKTESIHSIIIYKGHRSLNISIYCSINYYSHSETKRVNYLFTLFGVWLLKLKQK